MKRLLEEVFAAAGEDDVTVVVLMELVRSLMMFNLEPDDVS